MQNVQISTTFYSKIYIKIFLFSKFLITLLLRSNLSLHKLWVGLWVSSIVDQGCEIWIGLYGPTGITENRSSMQVFNSQEPAYTRKAVNHANRGQTSRV